MITTVIVEGVLRSNSVLESIRSLQRLAEIGEISLVQIEGLYEAAVLGYSPREVFASPGVLRVSGCRQDPPEKSVHYVLEKGTLINGKVHKFDSQLTSQEWVEVQGVFKKLKTKTLTCVDRAQQIGLVNEKLGQQRMLNLEEPRDYSESLPEGDFEPEFRRFIDDSVNLLSELDFNRRREDEGKPALNALWPWGGGIRLRFPNLALRNGIPRGVFLEETVNLHLAGLTRLSGYKTYPMKDLKWTHPFGKGAIIHHSFEGLKEEELEEKLDRFGSEWMEKLLNEFRHKDSVQLIFVNRDRPQGLRWLYSGKDSPGDFPLDERSFEERRISSNPLFEAINLA